MIAANDNGPTGAGVRFSVEPRLVPVSKAARRLHLTTTEFGEFRPALEERAFPLPCPVTGHYDLIAIDRWIDGLSAPIAAAAPVVPDFKTRLARLG